MRELTHLDAQGNAHMVDVGEKEITRRQALASGRICMSRECFEAVLGQHIKKGDVLGTARIAGIMATKRTSDLIPLCHPLAVTHVSVDFDLDEGTCSIGARCTVSCAERTGVEMEALTGVSVALLTIYDMCKAIDRSMEIRDIHVDIKSGGKSGDFRRCEVGQS